MVYNRPPFDGFHGDDKLKEILDPNHSIPFPPYRPSPVGTRGDEGDRETDVDEGCDMERVDADMIDVMRLTFVYKAQDRVTIPALLSHPLLRAADSALKEEGETVAISRATLKEILRKIYAFTRNGELHEHDLDERGDTLFDNIRDNIRDKHLP